MVIIVDYNAGNLRSVERAFRHLGIAHAVSDDPAVCAEADRIVFPGVGHAESAMRQLQVSGMAQALRTFVARGNPFLGICLGSQIILDHSEEGPVDCLGLLPGRVRFFGHLFGSDAAASGSAKVQADIGALKLGGYQVDGERLKVPHMGWNRVRAVADNPAAAALFEGVSPESSFYFVHSYYTEVAGNSTVLCHCEYGREFAAGISRGNVASFQFHPEKSGEPGLKLLANFAKWRP